MELNFKIENLKVNFGTDVLEFRTRDIAIAKYREKLEKASIIKDEDKKNAEFLKLINKDVPALLKTLLISGNKDLLELLTPEEIGKITEVLIAGFQQ